MSMAYGIDLGTTYSAIARMGDTGTPDIIVNQQSSESTLPSAVYFDDNNNAVIGRNAKEAGIDVPERLCQFFKRWIGRDNDPDMFHYIIDGEEHNPVELSGLVLKKIKEYAEQTGERVQDVVITVPAYFNLAQRAATIQAGKAAGLNVLATINEPTAAALSYCAGNMTRDQIVLVYDLGGGTFDITMLQMKTHGDGSIDARVVVTAGDAMLGGADWDARVVQLLLQKYAFQYGIKIEDIDREVVSLIAGSAEKAKCDLTEMSETTIRFRFSGDRVRLSLSRAEFNAATADLLQKTAALLEQMLKKAESFGISEDQVNLVLEVGGSTRMLQVQELLNHRFPGKVQFYEPDKAVAMGAAIAANMLSRGINIEKYNEFITDIQPEDMEVDVTDAGQVRVTNRKTGESATVDREAVSADMQNRIARGEEILPEQLIHDGEISADRAAVGGIQIFDLTPGTFGVIVRQGDGSGYISDNLIIKDRETPCSETREYAAPGGDAIHLNLPVTESQSTDPEDIAIKYEDGSYSFPDATKNLQVKAELGMDVQPGLAPNTPVIVTVSFDKYANLHVTMEIPLTGDKKELDVNFSPVTRQEAEAMGEKVSHIKIIDDIE